MPFLVLKDVTVQNVNDESHTHKAGTVLSDFEVSDFVRDKIGTGEAHYRAHFEPLTDEEAKHHRVKATVAAGRRFKDGQPLDPPFDDYVGLHPEEIMDRMRQATSKRQVDAIKDYERAGLNRRLIVDFTAPIEREPFTGYDEMHVRQVLDKMAKLSDIDVRGIITYEAAHRRRPAILQYEKEVYEPEKPAAEATQEVAQV